MDNVVAVFFLGGFCLGDVVQGYVPRDYILEPVCMYVVDLDDNQTFRKKSVEKN